MKRQLENFKLRAAAGGMTACLVVSMCAPAALALDPTHSEALYVTLDAYGKPTESSVVKSYSRNGAKTITDYGDYTNVVNMTSESKPVTKAGAVSFNFTDDAPNRFYFEGKTTKPIATLPWTIKVSYKLNGVPKEASQLAGEKGLVEITINAVANKSASAYFQNNMVMSCATMLDADDMLSVEAPGAQVQEIGSKTAVLFMAMPGETDTFTIRIGADSFQFPGLYFTMTPATLQQLDQITDLRDAKNKIEDSGNAMSDSMDVVLGTMGAMQSSISATASGLDILNQARSTISGGKGTVYAKADAAMLDLDSFAASLGTVEGHLTTTQKALTDTKNQINALVTTAVSLKDESARTRSSIEKVQKDITALQSMITDVDQQNKYTQDVIDDLKDNIRVLGDDFDSLSYSLTTLSKTLQAVKQASLSTTDTAGLDALITQAQQAYGAASDATQQSVWGAQLQTLNAMKALVTGINTNITTANALVQGLTSATNGVVSPLQEICKDIGQDNTDNSITERLWELADVASSYLTIASKYTGNMTDLADQANKAGDIAKDVTTKLDAMLDNVDGLNKVLNTYEPDAQKALEDAKKVSSTAITGITNTNAFLRSFKSLLQSSGGKLDTGTQATLDSTAAALRKAAEGLGQTGVLQNAKDTIKDLIDSEWDSHTGEDNNLLNMDPNAKPTSFTSAQNAAPTNLQVVLRTESIDNDEDEDTLEQDESYHAEGNFLTRLWNVVKAIGAAIGTLFS